MTTTKRQTDSSENNNMAALNAQASLDQTQKEKKIDEATQAALLSLSQALKGVLDQAHQAPTASNNRIVHPDFNAAGESSETQEPSGTQAPSNTDMQEAIGELMGLLADLEGAIAKYGNETSNRNSHVGTSLLTVMQARVQQAQDQLDNITKAENSSTFWSTLTKWAEAAIGTIATIALFTAGHPELAFIVGAMTVLSLSGATDGATNGVASVVMNMIPGTSQQTANLIASVFVTAVSIAVTGAGAALYNKATASSAEVVDGAVEAGEEGAGAIANNVAQAAVNAANEASESIVQRFFNFLVKVGSKLKENNPFNQLSKTANLSLVSGSMAVANTNLGQNLALVLLSKMKDGNDKDSYETAINMVINMMAALVGAGAGAAVFSQGAQGAQVAQVLQDPRLLKGLMAGMLLGGLGQVTGQIGEGVAQGNLATATAALGQAQAEVTMSQAMLNMNNGQLAANISSLKGILQAHFNELATLGQDVVKESAEFARILQA